MIRRAIIKQAIFSGVILTAITSCVSAAQKSEPSVPATTVNVTTSKPVATPTTTLIATTTPAPTELGEVVELAEYGFRFRLPASLQQIDPGSNLFRAVGVDPLAVMAVDACSDCSLDQTEPRGDTYTEGEINGVPYLLVENAEMGNAVSETTNVLIIVNGDRSLTAAMTVEGDITPVWDAFFDSIEISAPDPSSSTTTIAPTPTTAALGTNMPTVADLGLTFTLPPGFVSEGSPAFEGIAYDAHRSEPFGLLLVINCPGCTKEELLQRTSDGAVPVVTETTVAGYPALVADVDLDGPARSVLVLNPGREFIIVLSADDLDAVWQPLVDSIKIT